MASPFSISESLQFGWHKTRQHSALLFQVVLLVLAISLLQTYVSGHASHGVLWGIGDGLLLVCGVILEAGIIRIALKLAREEQPSIRDLIPPWLLIWQYILSTLAVAFFIILAAIPAIAGVIAYGHFDVHMPIVGDISLAVGALLSVVLMAYIGLRFALLTFVAIDGQRNIKEILTYSSAVSKKARWHLLLFFLVVIVLNVLGAVLFFVGLLLVIPITTLATAHVYLLLAQRNTPTVGTTPVAAPSVLP